MWVAKFKLKHDCIIGSKCEKFKVTDTGISFNIYQEKGKTYSPQIHTVHGEDKNVRKFLSGLKKDKRITNLEIEKDSFFCVEVRKEKVPSTFKTEKIIFVKPIFVDKEGYETWEVASWQKNILVDLMDNIEKDVEHIEILKLNQTKLTDVYYLHLMPKLTPNQKRAIELAFENGYYDFPKRSSMEKLARVMKISAPTYCEHLAKAEKKLMPDVINSLE